jgi:phosphatidylinositol kinase/protein kinase (PI-3  family)
MATCCSTPPEPSSTSTLGSSLPHHPGALCSRVSFLHQNRAACTPIASPTFHSAGGFERAPFKLTKDIVDSLRGNLSSYFEVRKYSIGIRNVRVVQALTQVYTLAMEEAFLAVRRRGNELLLLVECVGATLGTGGHMRCFDAGLAATLAQLKARLMPNASEEKCRAAIRQLIADAQGALTTSGYDAYQKMARSVTRFFGW